MVYYDFTSNGRNLCSVNGGDPLQAGAPWTDRNRESCAVSASRVTKQRKSSCVRGPFGNSNEAVCVGGQDTNRFVSGNNDATVFEVSFPSGDAGSLTEFCFYERASTTNENFGRNYPPREFGIRVTKNGQQIFLQDGLSTSSTWTQRCIDFSRDSDFDFSGSTTFEIELLGYNPSDDRRDDDENIWELDEFSVFGCCGDVSVPVTFIETCTQRITINDTERPTLTGVPANVTISCADDIPAVSTNVVANDNCSFETSFNEEIISGTEPCDYVIRRTWEVVDACGNSRSANQLITIENDIVASIDAPNSVCEGDPIALTVTGSGGCEGYSYSWSNNANTRSTTINNPNAGNQTYSVTITDSNGCTADASINVLVDPLPPVTNVTSTDETCEEENGSITLSFDDTSGRTLLDFSIDGGNTYPFESIRDNSGSFTISDLTPGTYDLYVRWGDTDCPTPLQAVVIDPDPIQPITNVVSTDEICEGEDGTITISFGDTSGRTLLDFSLDGGNTYPFESIPDNSGSFTISDLAPGTYDLYVRWGDTSCPMELQTVVIAPQPLPEAMVTTNGGDMNCVGQAVTLEATGAGPGGSYLWDNGLGAGATQTVSPLAETTYTVTVTDGNGCTDVESVTVEVAPCGSIGSIIWSDDNNNGIRDANEATLGEKGKTVTLELLDANTGQVIATTTSTTTGEYVFDNLFPGDYIVQFIAPDTNPVSSTTDFDNDDQTDDNDNGVQQDTDGDGLTDGLVQSNVVTLTPAGEPTGDPGLEQTPDNFGDNTIDFGLIPLVSVGSTVFIDDNNNGVQDPGEEGIDSKGKTVTLELVDANSGQVVATTTTTADGSYLFDNLLPGDYFIQFIAPDTAPVSSTTDFDADDQVDGNDNGTQQDTDGDGLTDGLITSNVFTLSPNDEPTGEPGTNGGKDGSDDDNGDMTIDFGLVRLVSVGSTVFLDDNNNGVQDPGEDGLDAKGKTVTLELLDAESGQVVATTTTTEDGSYLFDNLLPGDYFIQFEAPESAPLSSCLLYTSTSPRDQRGSRMPSSA